MEQGKINRIRKENNFLLVDTGYVRNPNLSAKAKGVLTYILSLPDDWVLYKSELPRHFTDGKDSIRAALKELEAKGYLTQEETRDEKGRILHHNITVYEVPIHGGFSATDKPQRVTRNGKPATTKNYSTKNELTKNDLTNITTTTGVNEFQQLADIYTSKINQNLQAVHEFLEDDLDEFGLELITEAINEAALANIRNYKYVRAILSGWKDRGVTTLQGVIQDRADFEEKKQSQQKRKSWSPTKETAMKKTPEWLEKDAEEQRAYEKQKRDELAASVPDDDELEKLLAEMRGGA